jgi:hypothetical protein
LRPDHQVWTKLWKCGVKGDPTHLAKVRTLASSEFRPFMEKGKRDAYVCEYVYVCMCVYVYVCMCVCVYVCMCVCVYVCMELNKYSEKL